VLSIDLQPGEQVLLDSPAVCHGVWTLNNQGHAWLTNQRLVWVAHWQQIRWLIPGRQRVELRLSDVRSMRLDVSKWFGGSIEVAMKNHELYSFRFGSSSYLALTDALALLPVHRLAAHSNNAREWFEALADVTRRGRLR
jgi:hypothetical protein